MFTKIDKKDLLVYLVYLIMTAIFFFRFLDGSEIFAFKDLSRYFYPLRHLMVEQARAGHFPLWNPYIFCGMPLLAAMQIGFFYPLTILYYLLPFDLAFNYYIILHYFLAACFTYLLMRHYQLGRPASFMSGMLFAFSGYLLSVSNMNTSLTSVVWLPLVVLWWDKVLARVQGNLHWFILFLAMMLLGGEPTIIYITIWLLFFYTLVMAREKLKALGWLGTAVVAVLLLCMVQLLPFAELAMHSDRSGVAGFEFAAMRSLPFREVINVVFPFFFGNMNVPGSYTEGLLGAQLQDWLISPYLGIFPLFFALLGFLKPDKRSWFWGGAAAAALVLAFGKYTPLYGLLYKFIPGVSLIRYPVKYIFLATFSLAALAGFGFDDCLKRLKENRLGPVVVALGLLFIVMGIISLYVRQNQFHIYQLLRGLYPELLNYHELVLAGLVKFNVQSLVNLTYFVFAGLFIVYLAYKNLFTSGSLAIFFAAIIFLDLAAVNISINRASDPMVYHEVPPNIKILLKDQGLFRLFYTPELEETNRFVYGFDFNQALVDSQDQFAANRLLTLHLFDSGGYESILLKAMRIMRSTMFEKPFKSYRPLVDMMNAKYVAAERPLKEPGLKLLKQSDYGYKKVYLYKNLKAWPRAVLFPKGRVKVMEYAPWQIDLLTSQDRPGELFLSETYYPGWRVFIDGKETKIEPSHKIFRQVRVPAGKHRVRFTYDPSSFKLGAIISLLTLTGLVWAGIMRR
ncbi:MAG: YfhO family protein [Candidatus Margulisiibacteriota bacterium]